MFAKDARKSLGLCSRHKPWRSLLVFGESHFVPTFWMKLAKCRSHVCLLNRTDFCWEKYPTKWATNSVKDTFISSSFYSATCRKVSSENIVFSFVPSAFGSCVSLLVAMSTKWAEKLDPVQRRFHCLMRRQKWSRGVDLSLPIASSLPSRRFLSPTRRTKRYSNSFIL